MMESQWIEGKLRLFPQNITNEQCTKLNYQKKVSFIRSCMQM